jgi:hypothetical protein
MTHAHQIKDAFQRNELSVPGWVRDDLPSMMEKMRECHEFAIIPVANNDVLVAGLDLNARGTLLLPFPTQLFDFGSRDNVGLCTFVEERDGNILITPFSKVNGRWNHYGGSSAIIKGATPDRAIVMVGAPEHLHTNLARIAGSVVIALTQPSFERKVINFKSAKKKITERSLPRGHSS